MKYFVTVFLILYMLTSYIISDNQKLLEQASYHYKNSQFEEALSLYETLHDKFPNNIDVIFNLGNTHFKLNNLGFAIGYYLKAIKWEPSNSELRYNLSLTRNLIKQTIEPSDSILYSLLGWLRFLSINTAFNIMMVLLLIGLVTLRLIYLKKFNRELLTNILIICGISLVLSFSLFIHRYIDYSQEKGVVVTKKQAVYSGPSENLSVLFYIHEGYEFKINKSAGNWVELELSNGFKGWAPLSSLFLI